jgi:hypothetical protein
LAFFGRFKQSLEFRAKIRQLICITNGKVTGRQAPFIADPVHRLGGILTRWITRISDSQGIPFVPEMSDK